MTRIFNYTKEQITQLILRDLEEQHGLELSAEQILVFNNNDGTYMISVPEMVEPDDQNLDNDPFEDIDLDEDENTSDTPLDVTPNSTPEYTEYHEIRQFLEEAIESQSMVEIVYKKRRRGEEERSARIITPLRMEDDYLRTMLHVTLRDGEIEYTTEEDNKRTFIVALIERVRLAQI